MFPYNFFDTIQIRCKIATTHEDNTVALNEVRNGSCGKVMSST